MNQVIDKRTVSVAIPGPQGPAGAFSEASATTLPPGSSPTVTVGGEAGEQTIEFGIPQGDKGDPGAGSVNSVNGDLGPDIVLDAGDVGAVEKVNGKTGTEITLTPGDLGATEQPDDGTLPIRSANGRLPGVGTPTQDNDAANKKYADTLLDIVSDDLEEFESQVALTQDLLFSIRIDSSLLGGSKITGAAEAVLMVAPFDLEITSVDFVFDDVVNIGGTANSCNMRIVRRSSLAMGGVNIVQKSTTVERIGGTGDANRRKPWSMTNGIWNTGSDGYVPAGQYLSWVVGSVVGSISIPLPAAITIGYRARR